MMKNMISNITKKARVGIAALAGIMMMTMATPFTASAQTINSDNETEATDFHDCETKISDRYYERVDHHNDLLCAPDKKINLRNWGLYHATNIKLYGRKALSVGLDGEFILGDWEQLYESSSLIGCGMCTEIYTISADYVAFAFSYDIRWGTDYPYSGVFWNNIYDTNWDTIDINLGGTVRMANIEIKVGNKTVVKEDNCSRHIEWTPEA